MWAWSESERRTFIINATPAACGRGRDKDRPLLIGSVKTNIGHLEPAAGVAGVIKTVLAMKRGLIPKYLHFRNPNPAMDWDRLPLQVTATPMAWPTRSDRPLLAGVSGFGWSGTNAHVVLEGYATPDGTSSSRDEGHWAAGPPRSIAVALPASVAEQPQPDHRLAPRRTRFLPLSGKSDGALRDLAGRYLAWLDEREAALASEGALTSEGAGSDPCSPTWRGRPPSGEANSATAWAWCSTTRSRSERA